MNWARFTSSSLRRLWLGIRWGAVAICLIAMMVEGISHWRSVGARSMVRVSYTSDPDTVLMRQEGRFLGDGRFGFTRSEQYWPTAFAPVPWTLSSERVRNQPTWRTMGFMEFSQDRKLLYGFFYERNSNSLSLVIPLYMIWLPTLPLAVWVIVRHVRRRKAGRVKGFEPIISE